MTTALDLPLLRPSQVIRLIKKGRLPRIFRDPDGLVFCERCRQSTDDQTSCPDYWENGSYVWCDHCEHWTLARPRYPGCAAYPNGFEIVLTGERKSYPLIHIDEKNLPCPKKDTPAAKPTPPKS